MAKNEEDTGKWGIAKFLRRENRVLVDSNYAVRGYGAFRKLAECPWHLTATFAYSRLRAPIALHSVASTNQH